jgi:hypothetical protein
MMETDPDWAPSLNMGHKKTATNPDRAERIRNRSTSKQASTVSNSDCAMDEDWGDDFDADQDCSGLEMGHVPAVASEGVQTDLTGADIDRMRNELNQLYEDKRCLQEKLDSQVMFSEDVFDGNNDVVRFYTGLPSSGTFKALLKYLAPNLPQGNRRIFSPFQLLLVVFMRLRFNFPLQHIAYLFGVHRTTVSNAFKDVLSIMYTQLRPLVRWPEREQLRMSMPHQFVEAFGRNVAVIIDCFEVFIERPSNLRARAETYSHYKHNNTLKYLIGITPKGEISFISHGWGGRTSDRHITENSGFLNKLNPDDVVLADRGFDIAESVGLMYAYVKIPAFTKGQSQLKAKDVEETRKIAHLRIHVERVIGNLGGKYKLLTDVLPIEMVLPCKGEEITFLDKIVVVCCALTNMCPSIVQ